MYLLPIKTEMNVRDRRGKQRSGNNRFITMMAIFSNFMIWSNVYNNVFIYHMKYVDFCFDFVAVVVVVVVVAFLIKFTRINANGPYISVQNIFCPILSRSYYARVSNGNKLRD